MLLQKRVDKFFKKRNADDNNIKCQLFSLIDLIVYYANRCNNIRIIKIIMTLNRQFIVWEVVSFFMLIDATALRYLK